MADTTTVKVQVATRELVNRLGEERRWTADQVISAGVASLRREQRRLQASREAVLIAADDDDLAEVRAVQADLDALRAG